MSSHIPICFALISLSSFSQETKVYSRTDTIKGVDGVSTLALPQVILKDTLVQNRINRRLSTDSIFELSLQEFQSEFQRWSEFNYAVNLNSGNILDITFDAEYYGAYPSTVFSYFHFDTKNGEIITAATLFNKEGIDAVTAICNDWLQKQIIRPYFSSTINGFDSTDIILARELVEGKKFRRDDLESFTLDADSITFHYSFEFPHCCRALEPDGVIKFSYTNLQSYFSTSYRETLLR